MEKSKWFEKAWSTVIAIPCVPVAYAWLAAEGPEWLRPVPDKIGPGPLDLAGFFLVSILIARTGWCFYRADQAE